MMRTMRPQAVVSGRQQSRKRPSTQNVWPMKTGHYENRSTLVYEWLQLGSVRYCWAHRSKTLLQCVGPIFFGSRGLDP